ncbi:DUF1752-domain-containing protein [Colletotrichum somersetense]|nr:DUF1752-domain-containing protein [Colletotrichum somersetense]
MSYHLGTHVLTVDTSFINKVDTSNPQNLYNMWTVFGKCAESVEQGRRLENLSWRLWNRATFCCTEDEQASTTATSLPREIPGATRLQDIPQLSGSVDSENDDEAVDFTSLPAPLEVDPRIQRQDLCASNRSRGKERHITSGDFEKMVVSIIKENEPLSAPLPQISSPYIHPQEETLDLATVSSTYENSGSTTAESPCKSSEEEHSKEPVSYGVTSRTTVVRGFKVMLPTAVESRSSPKPEPIRPKKQPMFSLGGSCSSSEQDHNFEDFWSIRLPKLRMFQVGGFPEEDSSLKSALASQPGSSLNGGKETTFFADRASTCTIDDSNLAISDDSDTDYIDESAIDDDDDSSNWEDSVEDSNKSSIDEKTFFQRVDSKVNLSSRRSLITLMIEQNDPKSNSKALLGNIASQSTSELPWSPTSHMAPPTLAVSSNDSDDAPLMMKRGVRPSLLNPINETPGSTAQPIYRNAGHNHHPAVFSPRTTRRNMFVTELSESLRRNLLWERQQRSSTANAVLKRRHTSHSVANQKQYPENNINNNFRGYHSRGW